MAKKGNLIDTKEAAKLLGISMSTVVALVGRGELKSMGAMNRSHIFREQDVIRLMKKRMKESAPAAPKKSKGSTVSGVVDTLQRSEAMKLLRSVDKKLDLLLQHQSVEVKEVATLKGGNGVLLDPATRKSGGGARKRPVQEIPSVVYGAVKDIMKGETEIASADLLAVMFPGDELPSPQDKIDIATSMEALGYRKTRKRDEETGAKPTVWAKGNSLPAS